MTWANPEKYRGLIMSLPAIALLNNNPVKFKRCCNGVGSLVGFWARLFYHFIPNTIWGLDITPASDIHDVEYSVPDKFNTLSEALKHKKKADYNFYLNMEILIMKANSWGWVESFRLNRAKVYYFALRKLGEGSFLAGKTILDYDK